MQIETTNQIDYSKNCRTLIFGPKGGGKTPLCATAPNPIILDIEGGTLSLADEEVKIIRNIPDVATAKRAVKLARDKKFNTIAIDSLTKLAEQELNIEKKNYSDVRHVYGAMQDTIMDFVLKTLEIPVNIIFVCREGYVETKAGIRFVPDLPGRVLPKTIPYEFDYVLRLETFENENKEIISRLWCKPTPNCNTGDRSAKLNATEPPDLTALFLKAVGKPKLSVVQEKSK